MTVSKKPQLIALVVLALGVIAIVYWRGSSPSLVTGLAAQESAPGSRQHGGEVAELAATPARAVIPTEEVLPETQASPQERPPMSTPERLGVGSLQGRIYGADGTPIARGKIFMLASRGAWKSSEVATTKEDGSFSLKNLVAGTWDIYYRGQHGGENLDGRIKVDTIQIERDRQTTYDIVLQGTRTLQGGFFDGLQDATLRELELYAAYDMTSPIATANCVTQNEEYKEYLKNVEHEDPAFRVAPTLWPPGRGCFKFTGLAAELYELRLYLDIDKQYYITATVDLRSGDKQFEPIEMKDYEQYFLHERLDL